MNTSQCVYYKCISQIFFFLPFIHIKPNCEYSFHILAIPLKLYRKIYSFVLIYNNYQKLTILKLLFVLGLVGFEMPIKHFSFSFNN